MSRPSSRASGWHRHPGPAGRCRDGAAEAPARPRAIEDAARGGQRERRLPLLGGRQEPLHQLLRVTQRDGGARGEIVDQVGVLGRRPEEPDHFLHARFTIRRRRARAPARRRGAWRVAAFPPRRPVANDRMVGFIGRVGGRASSIGPRALRWNGIRTRLYALTPQGEPLHSNASMSANAVQTGLADAGVGREDLQTPATATTQGDYLVPGHASAVHAELGGGPLELASFQSVCASSLMAARAAWLSVRTGEHECAATVASEFSSRWFRPSFYAGNHWLMAREACGRKPTFCASRCRTARARSYLRTKPPPGVVEGRVDRHCLAG